jgi:hypothetical protein
MDGKVHMTRDVTNFVRFYLVSAKIGGKPFPLISTELNSRMAGGPQ